MTDKDPIILTEKQRGALIHCTRLRRGLKARLEQAEPGTQIVHLTRKELDEFQSEVGQAVYYAASPYKRPLLSVVKKVADALEAAEPFTHKATHTVFQLRITLLDTRPPIWRQVQIKDCTLARLHEVVQVAMGGANYHMYYFEAGGDHPESAVRLIGATEGGEHDF